MAPSDFASQQAAFEPTKPLTSWRKAKEVKKKPLAGQTQHLEACYKVDDEVFVQNPWKT